MIPGTDDSMLARLGQVFNVFDIRVEQGGKPVYLMDLGRCMEYLSAIRQQLKTGERDLRSFIDQDILKFNDWMKCVDEYDANEDQLVSFCFIGLPPAEPVAYMANTFRAEPSLRVELHAEPRHVLHRPQERTAH
jgi:hypothetical protein